jgi:hypothetical protein
MNLLCIRCLVETDETNGQVAEAQYLIEGDAICEDHARQILNGEAPAPLEWATQQTWQFISYSQYAFTFEAKDVAGVRGIAIIGGSSGSEIYRIDITRDMTWVDLVEQGEPGLRLTAADGALIYTNF